MVSLKIKSLLNNMNNFWINLIEKAGWRFLNKVIPNLGQNKWNKFGKKENNIIAACQNEDQTYI